MQSTYFRLNPSTFLYWVVLTAIMVGLYFTTTVNYLLFHTIVELFSIIIASTVFILTWSSLQYLRNPYLVTVGISYLFVAILDLLHTMAYPGMPIFTDYQYYANQVWVAARYVESITLFASFVFLSREKMVRAGYLFVFYLAVTSLLITSIFYWKTFPVCFVEGKGLTPFKIYSEFVICGILAGSMYLLSRNRRFFSPQIFRLILLSIGFAIGSEVCFTLYVHNYALPNLIGHYCKLFSFLMIYHAIVATGIEEPFQLIFGELNRSNESLRSTQAALEELNQELEKRVAERTRELQEKDQLLMIQGRQAAMGEMIGHIAHQWRQPLNSLALLVQEVQLMYEMGQVSKGYVDGFSGKALELIQHMSRTIDDFRNFFRPDKEKVAFKVRDIVDRTLSLVRGTFREQGIDVEVEQKDDASIAGFPNEFSQVLLNILINARDALLERNVAQPKVAVKIAEEGGRAVVTITDNAGGIPEEVIERIFEPYFTTKGAHSGTGVGLSMSRTIIEKSMGGRLSVRNAESGAEFRIEL